MRLAECGTCAQLVDTTRWRPVAMAQSRPGGHGVVQFCSEGCKNRYLAGSSQPTSPHAD